MGGNKIEKKHEKAWTIKRAGKKRFTRKFGGTRAPADVGLPTGLLLQRMTCSTFPPSFWFCGAKTRVATIEML